MLRDPRLPGPTGLPAAGGGRTPGPLRLGPIFLADAGVVAVARKTLMMPAPKGDEMSLIARDVTWDLYKRGGPAVEDIFQTSLPNCPLAALLASLANSPKGRQFIQKIVTEHKATAVDTDVSAAVDQLAEPLPPGKRVTTQRYFEVTLGGKAIEVSPVLYTDEGDAGWQPTYMRPPTEALWACLIEKAYAVKEGDYFKLDGIKLTAAVFWEGVMGRKPEIFGVSDKTLDASIKDVAKDFAQTAAVAASREDAADVETLHGYAILGMDGNKVKLYNPHGKRLSVTLDSFRKNFNAVLFGDIP